MWKTSSIICGVVLILVALGIVMLASTSALHGEALYKDPHHFVKKQVAAAVAGTLAAIVAARVPYRYLKPWIPVILLATLVLLVMVLIPSIGLSIKGSRRWLRGPGVNIQPSEFGKLAVILTLAWWYSGQSRQARDFFMGFVVPGMLMGAVAGLVFAEPDFGTTMLIGVVGLSMMFVSGIRKSILSVAAVLGVCGFMVAIMHSPERLRRIIAFLDLERYAEGENYQLINALTGFIAGGVSGVGLGGSMQKQFYLPEAHTDFIFAIIGEELGIGASLGIVLLFGVFFMAGLRVAFKAADMFGKLLAFGITILLTLQAALNIGVVTGCLPTKGLPLPFISFGGTAMVVNLLMVGILLNVARTTGSSSLGTALPRGATPQAGF